MLLTHLMVADIEWDPMFSTQRKIDKKTLNVQLIK